MTGQATAEWLLLSRESGRCCLSREATLSSISVRAPAFRPEAGAIARGAPGLQPRLQPADICPVDDGQDPEAWADAFLDQHRSTPRRDLERDREAAVRALRDLPTVTRWMLTQGGREPDLEIIERIQRNSRRLAIFQKWETIVTLVGVALLCGFALVSSSAF
jgi:hypothetical protein